MCISYDIILALCCHTSLAATSWIYELCDSCCDGPTCCIYSWTVSHKLDMVQRKLWHVPTECVVSLMSSGLKSSCRLDTVLHPSSLAATLYLKAKKWHITLVHSYIFLFNHIVKQSIQLTDKSIDMLHNVYKHMTM